MEEHVKVKFYYWHERNEEEAIESMWTIPVSGNYKIDNIPFYVQSFALGDIISVTEKAGQLYVDALVKESGNSTIQMVFFDETIVHTIRGELKAMGCTSEISDKLFLIAINVPAEINYLGVIKPYLDDGYTKNLWDYGEACIASNHTS